MATELTDEVSNEVEVNTSATASGPPSPQGEGYGGPSGSWSLQEDICEMVAFNLDGGICVAKCRMQNAKLTFLEGEGSYSGGIAM